MDASVTGGYHHSVKAAVSSLIRYLASQSIAGHPWSLRISNCLADEGYNLWLAILGKTIKPDCIHKTNAVIMLCAYTPYLG